MLRGLYRIASRYQAPNLVTYCLLFSFPGSLYLLKGTNSKRAHPAVASSLGGSRSLWTTHPNGARVDVSWCEDREGCGGW